MKFERLSVRELGRFGRLRVRKLEDVRKFVPADAQKSESSKIWVFASLEIGKLGSSKICLESLRKMYDQRFPNQLQQQLQLGLHGSSRVRGENRNFGSAPITNHRNTIRRSRNPLQMKNSVYLRSTLSRVIAAKRLLHPADVINRATNNSGVMLRFNVTGDQLSRT